MVVGEGVNVRALRQEFQRLLVGGHKISRLHPGKVLLFGRAEHAELLVGLVDRGAADIDRREVDKVVGQRGEVAVKAAQQVDRAGTCLRLRLDAGEPRPLIGRLVVDASFKTLEHVVAHLLGFLDRLGLGRPKQDIGRRAADAQRQGERRSRHKSQCPSHVSFLHSSSLSSHLWRRGAAPWLARGVSVGRSNLVCGVVFGSWIDASSMPAASRPQSRMDASKVVRPGGA